MSIPQDIIEGGFASRVVVSPCSQRVVSPPLARRSTDGHPRWLRPFPPSRQQTIHRRHRKHFRPFVLSYSRSFRAILASLLQLATKLPPVASSDYGPRLEQKCVMRASVLTSSLTNVDYFVP